MPQQENIYDLEQQELTTGTNAIIYTLLLAGIHTKGESEKSKYILMVLPSRIMSSIWPTYQFFLIILILKKICYSKHHKNGEKYFRRLALVEYKLSIYFFHWAKTGQMLNFIGVNFKPCTLGQKDHFRKVVICNGFVLVLSCGQNIEFCEHDICQLQVFYFNIIDFCLIVNNMKSWDTLI